MCTIKLLGITWSLLRTLPNVPYITKYLHSGQRRHKLFPAFHELWKLFSYCFPIVLSLPWRRSCHHLRIKTQPKTEGEPSADLQNACTLACNSSTAMYPQSACPTRLPSLWSSALRCLVFPNSSLRSHLNKPGLCSGPSSLHRSYEQPHGAP